MRMIKRKVSQYDIRSMIWPMIRQRNKKLRVEVMGGFVQNDE